eukprot:scaffold754_cov248-Pinguiococcus_pyrenoidosus.AAC.57
MIFRCSDDDDDDDLPIGNLATDLEPSQETAAAQRIVALELHHHVLHRAQVHVEGLRGVLGENADAQARVHVNVPVDGPQLRHDEIQQGTLACTVGAHENQATVQVDAEVDVLEKQPFFGQWGRRPFLGRRAALLSRRFALLGAGISVCLALGILPIFVLRFCVVFLLRLRVGIRKREAERLVFLDVFDALPVHFLDGLDSRLHQRRALRVGAELVDELLHVLSLCHVRLVHALLLAELLCSALLESVIVRLVVLQLLPIEVDDVGDDLVQEAAVVRHDEQGVRVADEVVLEPDHGLEIQVVGRLVQQEDVRLDKQGGRQRDTHAPASAERTGRAIRLLLCELQAGEDHARAGFGVACADGLQSRVDFLQLLVVLLGLALPVLRAVSPLLPLENLRFLLHQGQALHVGFHDHFHDRLLAGRHLLADVKDTQVGGKPLEVEARHRLEERGLSHAVLSDQAIPPSGRQPQLSSVQELRAVRSAERDVLDDDVAIVRSTAVVW